MVRRRLTFLCENKACAGNCCSTINRSTNYLAVCLSVSAVLLLQSVCLSVSAVLLLQFVCLSVSAVLLLQSVCLSVKLTINTGFKIILTFRKP